MPTVVWLPARTRGHVRSWACRLFESPPLSRFVLITIVCIGLCASSFGQSRPANVLLIVVDDIGWGELGFQGNSDIPTPNIDRIARDGVRFAQAYASAPLCAPSRAGLLTGRYQTRFGFEFHNSVYRHGIPSSVPTLAGRLAAAGYDTMAIGKWGVGQLGRYAPTERGFDEFYGTTQNTTYYRPRFFVDSRESDRPHDVNDPTFYTTTAYARRAVDWLKERDENPWFLYLSFNAAHAPLEPPGFTPRGAGVELFSVRQRFRGTIAALDAAVGDVLDQLRAMQAEQQTIVVFVSDNGGPTWETTSSNGGLRGVKSDLYEGGIRVPMCMRWPKRLPAGRTYAPPVSTLDIMASILDATNTPSDAPLDGVSLIPYLRGEVSGRPHDTFYWRMGSQWAIREGDWKLVCPTSDVRRPRLYNLAVDPLERRNQAARDPARVQRMQRAFDLWSAQQAAPLTPK